MDQTASSFAILAARRLVFGVAALFIWLAFALPLRAAPVDELMQALRIDDILEVMQDEGMDYGEELAADLLPGGNSAAWQARLIEIYDTDKMRTIVHTGFTEALEAGEPEPLVAFFTSDLGRRIIDLELSARRAMIDDTVEDAARESYRDLKGTEDARLAQVRRFIEVNDLLEANVTGALNASFRFYSGLVDGGGLRMAESDILSDVWAQEDETREDTREWLYAYLLLAYEPLEDEDLEAYIALSETTQGRALNQALFAGFNAMYNEISYALGLAAARQMQLRDL